MSDANAAEHYRLFVAMRLPEQIKSALASVQAELQSKLPEHSVTWTKNEQLHLTLKFLGNVAVAQIDALIHQLRTACSEFSPLVLRAERLGAFPDLLFPRVLWAGLDDASGKLAQMHETIEMASRDFTEEEPDKRFSAHVTLGRPKRLNAKDRKALSQMLSELSNKFFGEWTASEIELIRSQLSSQGASHITIQTFCFE